MTKEYITVALANKYASQLVKNAMKDPDREFTISQLVLMWDDAFDYALTHSNVINEKEF